MSAHYLTDGHSCVTVQGGDAAAAQQRVEAGGSREERAKGRAAEKAAAKAAAAEEARRRAELELLLLDEGALQGGGLAGGVPTLAVSPPGLKGCRCLSGCPPPPVVLLEGIRADQMWEAACCASSVPRLPDATG